MKPVTLALSVALPLAGTAYAQVRIDERDDRSTEKATPGWGPMRSGAECPQPLRRRQHCLWVSGAQFNNTTGRLANNASGFRALVSNTTGSDNTASGTFALYSNSAGNANTASGSSALYSKT